MNYAPEAPLSTWESASFRASEDLCEYNVFAARHLRGDYSVTDKALGGSRLVNPARIDLDRYCRCTRQPTTIIKSPVIIIGFEEIDSHQN
jgi:hypothetical protein